MSRYLFVFLAIMSVGFCGGRATAITVDGQIDDWPARLVLQDATDDDEGEASMLRWGSFVEDGTLYAVFEMDKDISVYAGGENDIWAGIWINIDRDGGPGNTPSSLDHNSGQIGTEWADGVHEGFDILVEWGVNEGHWGEGFNYWGADDDSLNQGSPVSGGVTAYNGQIIEFSVPVSNLLAELGTYPDDVTPPQDWAWLMGARVEASINGAGPWGGDNSDTLVLSVLPGDVNDDGAVNSGDLDIIRANWGDVVDPGDDAMGDLDGNGVISSGDLDMVRAWWGTTQEVIPVAPAAVPEPGVCILLLLGFAAASLRRVKR